MQPSADPSLTIFIPTFNRPQQLDRLLAQLARLRQHHDFRVIVSDNCSTEKLPAIQRYEALGFQFTRTSANLGGSANILRAFLMTETEYLWIIGDDDLPGDDALRRIEEDLRGGYDLINYEFNDSGRPRTRPRALTGETLDGFLSQMDHLSATLFISINIYRVRRFTPFLRFGYDAGFAWMPHLAVTLAALKHHAPLRYLYSNHQIVTNGWESTPEELRWNYAQVAPRFPTILRLLDFTDAQRTLLRRKVFECLHPGFFLQQILATRHLSPTAKADTLRQYLCDFHRELRLAQRWRLRLYWLAVEAGWTGGARHPAAAGVEGRLE